MHPLGIHHLVTARDAPRAASAGFEGKIRIWSESEEGTWKADGEISGRYARAISFKSRSGRTLSTSPGVEIVANLSSIDQLKTGDAWAIALSADGKYLAASSINGKINVWSLDEDGKPKIRDYETKGSFGMCVDLSRDGRFTVSGHENGSIYVFDNDTGRLTHSLAGLVKPVRSVAFSPNTTLLAAAGDSRTIALYDVKSGEQIANLAGHTGWVLALDWSDTGEYLLSGYGYRAQDNP